MSGPFVAKISLSHFRSHQRTELAFDGGPVAIYGPNGAGKTNLIEAVSLLSPGRGMRRAGAADLVRRPEAIGWKVKAEVASHEIETWAEPGGTRQVRIDGKLTSQVALGRILRVVWLVPAMDRLWIEGAEGRRRFLDRAVLSFDPSHAEAVLDYEKAMRERNRLLKDMVRDAHWYAAVEGQMARSGAAIHAGREATIEALMRAQAGSETAFPAADLALSHPEDDPQTTEDGLKDAFAAGRSRDLSAGRTLTGPHRADLEAIWSAKDVPARDCSTGEQKALLVSLILANARALSSAHPPVMLLDEVAAHLDDGRKAALYDEICALGGQAFMTGTGLELFTVFGARATYLEATETAGVSQMAIRESQS